MLRDINVQIRKKECIANTVVTNSCIEKTDRSE